MREMRPWTYQADYYGLASIAHCLLFGKYMDTTCYVNDDGLKTYKIQQSLRRYWQTDLWTRFFHLMLEGGVYLAPSAFEAGFTSIAHGDKELAITLDAAERAFAKLK